MKLRPFVLLVCLSGCATARLAGPSSFVPPDPGEPRVVVVEPFFETAEWKSTVKTEVATVMGANPGFEIGGGGAYGSPFSREVAVQRTVTDKPLFARVPALAYEHRLVIDEVQRLRPLWRVSSTGGAKELSGSASLVRVIVHESELIESDRALKNLAFAFGLVLWPLQFINLSPVEESVRVYGVVQRYDLPAESLEGRFVRYPSQPDYAVNTRDLTSVERRFGLDVGYTEGLFANEAPREGVLLQGFSQRLAAAIVALIEEHP